MNEKISALLDDELSARDRDRLLQEVSRDPVLRVAWERYHLIRAVLRKDIGIVMNPDLATRILSQIENDPVPHVRPLSRLPIRHFTRLTAGLAIAASVAIVAVVSFKSTLLPGPDPVSAVATAPAVPAAKTSAAPPTQLAQTSPDNSLNALLVKHNEFSRATTMNGMISYVRVVSQNSDQ
jgi:sigma-E factor negative regulatory protein RseA